MPWRSESSTVEWQSAQVMPTARRRLPSKKPESFRLMPRSWMSGRIAFGAFCRSTCASFGLSPGPIPRFFSPAIDWHWTLAHDGCGEVKGEEWQSLRRLGQAGIGRSSTLGPHVQPAAAPG